MSTSKRTLFACTWCGAEQILLDLDPRAVADAAEAWHTEHDQHDPHHDKPRSCDQCGAVSPVQAVDHRTVIGLTTFDQQAFMDWLNDHDCTPSQERILWDCLVTESDEIADIVHHDGDPSQVPGMPPRPAWAHPSNDYMWPDGTAGYFSDHALVTSEAHPAIGTADTVWRSRCSVRLRKTSARPDRTLVAFYGFSPAQTKPGRIEYQTVVQWRFTPAEARLVAERLTAAADLAESA